jgi:HTH-type transcriptional regulator/antitoxin HigA
MLCRIIKNGKDYETTLSRIEKLMGAKSGTKEIEELKHLTALVEMYEEQHFSISQPSTVDAIKFRMKQLTSK